MLLRFKLISKGKVRDLYEVISGSPLSQCPLIAIRTTDRVSVNDCVVGEIPGRGRLLNLMTIFWKKKIAKEGIINNDLNSTHLKGQSDNCSIVKGVIVIPAEIIVRRYLTGSFFRKYFSKGCKAGVCLGVKLPAYMEEWDRLISPAITPTTKAPKGMKDRPITHRGLVSVIKKTIESNSDFFECNPIRSTEYNIEKTAECYAKELEEASKRIFLFAEEYLQQRGIILADTKFEFGFLKTEMGFQIVLIDEVLTPDSSRFIALDDYRIGIITHLSKQTLRNWMDINPGKSIPKKIKKQVLKEYQIMFNVITS